MDGLTLAVSAEAQNAWQLALELQALLVAKLEKLALELSHKEEEPKTLGQNLFEKHVWGRNGGKNGGGQRLQASDAILNLQPPQNNNGFRWHKAFKGASSNISQVHYLDMPEKALGSATALSSIVHPAHPLLPSLHIHISYTQYKNGKSYWRIMADLNPSHKDLADEQEFRLALVSSSGKWFAEGKEQGDLYFFIPALNQHRGVVHFYLEEFTLGNFNQELKFAKGFGEAVISTYGRMLLGKVTALTEPKTAQLIQQLNYHSLYFLQVLTLDRGTTAGLTVHSDNDVGILGSLPVQVNTEKLQEWTHLLPPPQDLLLRSLISCLPAGTPAQISIETKKALADTLRRHYRQHPAAMDMQARGKILPPTIDNHLR